VVLLSACRAPQKAVVYDLARRAAVADRWSAREVLLFGTPAAEPHQVEGFYREAGGPEGDSFLWSKDASELSFTWPKTEARAAVVDLAPYTGARGQSLELWLNGASLARVPLSDLRHRYRFELPAAAQREGENRLRFVFAKAASPADADPHNGDKRRLAAAFYGLTVGAASDPALLDLLGRDAPAPFAVGESKGAPTLTLVGPAAVRYAVRLPAEAELRFSPDLHPAARAAGARASFRVTLETQAGEEREVWAQVVDARSPGPGEVRVPLPAAAETVARIGLHVSGERFAWGTFSAPRLLGRPGAPALEPLPLSPGENARADGLRRDLQGSNVVLIILDAARAKEFGAYGYRVPTTPEIDRVAREGVVFESVYTPAVYTLGAMASVWTSQQPDRHHSAVSFNARLPKDRLTLAEMLGARGIRTAGFVANAVAGRAFGFERGFDEFREVFREFETSSAGSFRKVLPGWFAANAARPFFAYVHFREPHYPYDPPPPFDTRFGPDGPIPPERRRDPAGTAFIHDVNQGQRRLTAEEADHLVRLYDGNLAFADQEVGAIRKGLEQAGLWDRTVVIVAADHGEELMEHRWIGHNVHVFEESAHVPLIVRFPAGKGPSGVRVPGLADLLDLAPTIADVFGALGPAVGGHFEGRSLLPMVAGGAGKAAVLSQTIWERPIYSVRDGAFAFLYDTRTGEERLYDRTRDPAETRDLKDAEPLRVAYYRQALHHWSLGLGRRGGAAGEAGEPAWTCEQCENMKALGYLGGDIKCPCP
jgi:arylsulfatase A-like enzyme